MQVAGYTHTHTPLTQTKSEWADYTAVQAYCGNLSGNDPTRNLLGNSQPQSSQLAEPLWTDPGLKSGISVCELISTSKKQTNKKARKAQAGSEWSNTLPKFMQTRKKPLHCGFTQAGGQAWLSRGVRCHGLQMIAEYTVVLHRLEARHGRPVVARAMAYTVASATGLSDLEMEDLLSMDDVVLNHLFKQYHPPLRRAPCTVWLKVPIHLLSFHFGLGIRGLGVRLLFDVVMLSEGLVQLCRTVCIPQWVPRMHILRSSSY